MDCIDDECDEISGAEFAAVNGLFVIVIGD
jgi:hypothetical protein